MNTENQNIMNANDFLDKIENGTPVENATINEDVYSDQYKLINSEIKVIDCIFEGCLRLSHKFEKNVDFSGSIFHKEVSFYRSHFVGTLHFSKRHDDGFKFAIFKGRVEFRDVEFNYVDLESVKFEDDVDFQEARFFNTVDFSSAVFKGIVEFNTTNLGRKQFNQGCKIRLNNASFHTFEVHWRDIKKYIQGANPSDYGALVKNYTNIGWFDDADNCFLAYKDLFWERDYLHLYSSYLNRKQKIKKLITGCTGISFKINNKYIIKIIKRIHKGERCLLYFLSFWLYGHFLSLFLYGHGITLKWPVFTGFIVILGSAFIYFHGNQVNSVWPDGIDLSLKIFISTTEVGHLTGFCKWWSILERFLGAILFVTSLVVLARKTLR
jgi:uncharacterized protein YjbI with pentapeptide repeats